MECLVNTCGHNKRRAARAAHVLDAYLMRIRRDLHSCQLAGRTIFNAQCTREGREGHAYDVHVAFGMARGVH